MLIDDFSRTPHARPMALQRVDQLLSSLGYCSRKEAREWVEDGRVMLDGKEIDDSGKRVNPAALVVDDEPLDNPAGLLLLLNKPTGLVCSHDGREGPAVYNLLPPRWRRRNPIVTSVGRLDKETSGLILLTDQSQLVHKWTSPKHKVPKTYVATLDRDVPEAEGRLIAERFAAGTLMLDGEKDPCAPAVLGWRAPRVAELILTEGRYHQVRRMFVTQGLTVTALHRERFGALTLGNLQPGEWTLLPLDQTL